MANTNEKAVETMVRPQIGQQIFLGMIEKKGHYKLDNGKEGDYHNLYIKVAEPYPTAENDSVVGHIGWDVYTYKVRYENVCGIFGLTDGSFNPMSYNDWLWKPVEMLYEAHHEGSSQTLVIIHPS